MLNLSEFQELAVSSKFKRERPVLSVEVLPPILAIHNHVSVLLNLIDARNLSGSISQDDMQTELSGVMSASSDLAHLLRTDLETVCMTCIDAKELQTLRDEKTREEVS